MNNFNSLFETIIRKHKALFLARAYRLTNCRQTAEDILQDAYSEIVERLLKEAELKLDEGGLKIMILRCIRWRAIDEYRKRKNRRDKFIPYDDDEEINALTIQIHHHITQTYISNYYQVLPKKNLKKVVVLANLTELEKMVLNRYLDGFKIDQIAKELKLDPRQVTNCKYRLLIKLKNVVTNFNNRNGR